MRAPLFIAFFNTHTYTAASAAQVSTISAKTGIRIPLGAQELKIYVFLIVLARLLGLLSERGLLSPVVFAR
jgi:hypothetical protein